MQRITRLTVASMTGTENSKSVGKGQHGSTALDKKTTSAFAQLSAKVERLEKANKKLKKCSKKRKRNYDSDSSDSDSS